MFFISPSQNLAIIFFLPLILWGCAFLFGLMGVFYSIFEFLLTDKDFDSDSFLFGSGCLIAPLWISYSWIMEEL
jgi:hypothetical protein